MKLEKKSLARFDPGTSRLLDVFYHWTVLQVEVIDWTGSGYVGASSLWNMTYPQPVGMLCGFDQRASGVG